MRPLGEAIAGAAAASILWFILNAWTSGVGTAIVRRLGWPLSAYSLVAVVGAIGGVSARSRGRRQKLLQSAASAGTATDLGLAYLPTVERPTVALPCLERWHSGKDGNIGEVGGVSVSVFDMTEHVDTFDGVGYLTRTIVLLHTDGLPAFTVSPRGAGRFAHLFGLGGMTFDPAAAPIGEAATVRQFGRSLRVELPVNSGPWTPATSDLRTAEESVRRLVTPTSMARILSRPGWSFQTCAGWLACWRGQTVCSAGERSQWISAATAIQAALLAAAEDASPIVLPPVQLPNGAQFITRALGTILGVLLGAYSAFFIAIFGIMPRHPPGVLLILPFLMAAVGGVVVGVLGYWMGAALGKASAIARWTPRPQAKPEQKVEMGRRNSWRRGCGCIGACVGFPAGLASLDHLIWSNDQASVWRGGLMLILPVGGGIAGLLCGVAIGGWVARLRAKSASRIGAAIDEPPQAGPSGPPDSRGMA